MRMATSEVGLGLLAEQWAERSGDLFEMERVTEELGREQERMREAMKMRVGELLRLTNEEERARDVWQRNNRRENSPFV